MSEIEIKVLFISTFKGLYVVEYFINLFFFYLKFKLNYVEFFFLLLICGNRIEYIEGTHLDNDAS